MSNKYNLSEKELTGLYRDGWRWIAKDEDEEVYLYNEEVETTNLCSYKGNFGMWWLKNNRYKGDIKLAHFSTDHNWSDSLYKIKKPSDQALNVTESISIELTLTNHKTTMEEQILKVVEKKEEFDKAAYCFLEDQTKHNARLVADETIDFIKIKLKWLKLFCEETDLDFFEELKNNHNKNEERGYHS